MRAEVKLLTTIFSDSDTYKWEIPIRHLIDTDYDCTVLGDACLEGGGAFCDELRFWYFLEWPDNIKKRTLKAKVKHSELVSINCLEFVIIIVSYNAILDAIELLGKLHNIPHPKSLILSDNTSADSWTRKIASSSLIGKALCRILCSLLVNQVAGLDSAHISGNDNDCADNISRLTKDSLKSISALFQKYPKLASYHRYHPAPELISLIYNALLNNSEEVPMPLRLKGHFSVGKNTL